MQPPKAGELAWNPVTGERGIVLEGPQENDERRLTVELYVSPGGAVVGEHLHPAIMERFEDTIVRIQPMRIISFGIDSDDVQLDKSFVDDLDVDSLSMVEVVVAAEEKFGVTIPDDEVKNLKTVGDAVAFIERAQNG